VVLHPATAARINNGASVFIVPFYNNLRAILSGRTK
jgi:hypothetical protein